MISDTKMVKADLQFAIDHLKKDNVGAGIEALVVSFLCVLTAVFLPEALFRLVFANGQSQADMTWLGYIPTAAYIVAALYSVYVLASNMIRSLNAKKLEKMLAEAKK